MASLQQQFPQQPDRMEQPVETSVGPMTETEDGAPEVALDPSGGASLGGGGIRVATGTSAGSAA